MNYEDVFEENLITLLEKKFDIHDYNRLITYLLARFSCLRGKCQIADSNEFIDFLLDEICATNKNSQSVIVHVDGHDVEFKYGYSYSNSLSNVYDSMIFGSSFVNLHNENGILIDIKSRIKEIFSDVNKKSKRKIIHYKNSEYKDKLLTLFRLNALNDCFGVTNISSDISSEFFYQNEIIQSAEELLSRYVHAENFETSNVKSVTESQVRDYLYAHLDLIEEGLNPIEKEFQTNEGRIDILASDADGNKVVIELKTEHDKRLIWQCVYYPDEIKKKFPNCNKIRMITIVPSYPDYLLSPIRKIGYVECFEYNLLASNNKIEKINLNKIDVSDTYNKDINNSNYFDINNLIDMFIYTVNRLKESLGDEVDEPELREIALGLISKQNNINAKEVLEKYDCC